MKFSGRFPYCPTTGPNWCFTDLLKPIRPEPQTALRLQRWFAWPSWFPWTKTRLLNFSTEWRNPKENVCTNTTAFLFYFSAFFFLLISIDLKWLKSFSVFNYFFLLRFCCSGTRPLASGNVIRQLITLTNVSEALSRPLWQLLARTYPAGTTSHWRWAAKTR